MMDQYLRTTLAAVRDGTLDVEEACHRLACWPHEELAFATIDHHRSLRSGFPEVVFCAGKSPLQASVIADRIWRRSGRLLATRASEEHAEAIRSRVAEARFNPVSRTVSAGVPPVAEGRPILIITAGTSDLPVAEEAVETIRIFGEPVARLNDVGVAGVHRLLAHQEAITAAGVVIAIAGMDGALASVVGGLVSVPVIAVPTSVGYGASFEGLAALLTMLTSCAAGVMVVNIDNGFGAGVAACRISSSRGSRLVAEDQTTGSEYGRA